MPLEPESDLHWTAFLYMSGDLAADEASAFEVRLADDPAARDALVGAVELARALAVVGPEFRNRRRPVVRLLVAASALAAAACLALAIGLWRRSTTEVRPDTSEVAIAWSSLRAGADAVDTEPDAEPEVDASSDRALPSWLISATAASSEEPGEDE